MLKKIHRPAWSFRKSNVQTPEKKLIVHLPNNDAPTPPAPRRLSTTHNSSPALTVKQSPNCDALHRTQMQTQLSCPADVEHHNHVANQQAMLNDDCNHATYRVSAQTSPRLKTFENCAATAAPSSIHRSISPPSYHESEACLGGTAPTDAAGCIVTKQPFDQVIKIVPPKQSSEGDISTVSEERNLALFLADKKESKPQKTKLQVCRGYFKQFIAFLFSHIGLSCLVVAYSLLGGIIFQAIESGHEMNTKFSVGEARMAAEKDLWNITRSFRYIYPKNWTIDAEKILRQFQSKIIDAVKEKGWSGEEKEDEELWTFAGALLYSVTIITTIGYGHITPKTDWGRIVTMFYALLGIPLMFLCLANIGNFFANTFRFIYKKMSICCTSKSEREKSASDRRRTKNRRDGKKRFNKNRALPRHSSSRRGGDNGATSAVGGGSDSDDGDSQVTNAIQSHRLRRPFQSKEKVSVPLTCSIMIIVVYIMGGALAFSVWEDNWDFLVGSYFCFITLSTIGFGDFVPGTRTETEGDQEKLIFCALYLLFGLAIICMAFDLMQEEVRNKFRWLARKIGIMDKNSK